MAPSGYLSVAGIEDALAHLAQAHPTFCTRTALPEKTFEGRTCSFVKIGASRSPRSGVLLLGGVHAREVVNPDLLVTFAFDLCRAYEGHAGLAFGPRRYTASQVKLVVENVDLYLFPLVNPDGRAFVLAPAGDAMWRKNRRPTVAPYLGVDVNRNFDFLWASGIGTSSNPADYQVYRGDAAMSEVESRNVRWLLDTYPIAAMADVHSYSELVMWPWGDDENQTTTPAMTFLNHAYDGARGALGDAYREYMPPDDLSWYADTGRRIAGGIAAVRGRSYAAEASSGLYPTSGVSNDYAYARHFAAAGERKVRAFAIETGREFQPAHAEALHVIEEVSAGLVELCLASVCVVESVAASSPLQARLDDLRRFRDRVLAGSVAGQRYLALLDRHGLELAELAARSAPLRAEALAAVRGVADVVLAFEDPQPRTFDAAVIGRARRVIARLAEVASPELRRSLALVSRELARFQGKDVLQALRDAPVLGERRRKRRTSAAPA